MNKVLKESGIIDFTFGGMNRTAFRMEPYRFEVLPLIVNLIKFSSETLFVTYIYRKFFSSSMWTGSMI